jgi:hypothetical protein
MVGGGGNHAGPAPELRMRMRVWAHCDRARETARAQRRRVRLGRHADIGRRVDVGLALQQQPHHLDVTVLG